MEKIPTKIQNLYIDYLKKNDISSENMPSFMKWLQYYLDFCSKYSHPKSSQESLKSFLLKLNQKNQTNQQIKQAQKAITLFYELVDIHQKKASSSPNQKESGSVSVKSETDRDMKKSTNQSWNREYKQLKDEINLRQYSVQALKTYTAYVRKFQAFLKSKSPELIDSQDAKNFITHLAVEKQVSASTQNLAFNSLLFFIAMF